MNQRQTESIQSKRKVSQAKSIRHIFIHARLKCSSCGAINSIASFDPSTISFLSSMKIGGADVHGGGDAVRRLLVTISRIFRLPVY